MTSPHLKDVTAETSIGSVRGLRMDSYNEFRGIPFAGDLSGSHRFRTAESPRPWSSVLEATQWPPAVPQKQKPATWDAGQATFYHEINGYDYHDAQSEHGLYLNLWTPALDGARRPVMVWLHGGGFVSGSPTRPREHGGRLSAMQDVVVVSPSHRLGALGYLWLGGLSQDYDSNVGMTDIILALEWVRTNISAFGGDPENVTVFGESGGSMKVQMLLAMPGSRGLFHKAICQSGSCVNFGPEAFPMSQEEALEGAERAIGLLGVDKGSLERLESCPSTVLDDALISAIGRGPYSFAPVVDGDTLPLAPPEAISAGSAANVPLLIGTSRHETRFQLRLGVLPHSDFELRQMLGPAGQDLLAYYYSTRGDAQPLTVAEDLLTDAFFRIPSIRIAERKASTSPSVYMYQFAWENVSRPDVGAVHGMDTPFIFNNCDAVEVARAPAAVELASKVSAAWAAFAKSGDPNTPALGCKWEPYDSAKRATMVFGHAIRSIDDPNGEDRIAWDTFGR